MASLLPWAIEAFKIAALAAIRPLFMALLSSLLSPKFLLKCFIQMAEMIVARTETKVDDKFLEDLKASLQEDLDKFVKKDSESKPS